MLLSSWLTEKLLCILICVVCPIHQGVWLNLKIFLKCILELLIVQLRRWNKMGWILELWIINSCSAKTTKWWVQAQRDATTTRFIHANVRLPTVLATCLVFFFIDLQKQGLACKGFRSPVPAGVWCDYVPEKLFWNLLQISIAVRFPFGWIGILKGPWPPFLVF